MLENKSRTFNAHKTLGVVHIKQLGQNNPKKGWINVVEEDLEDLRMRSQRESVRERDKWNNLVIAAKTLGEYWKSEEEEELTNQNIFGIQIFQAYHLNAQNS